MIMESCMSKKAPNVVTLPASTLIQGGKPTTPIPVSRSCRNKQASGVYEIYLDSHVKFPTSVYCDAYTDGSGWIVIMRLEDGSVDFNRTWEEYKNGFGDVGWQFWIGNGFLHELTKSKPMELRVDMEYAGGDRVFAKYAVFKVGSEEDKYVLAVSGYSGTAGDALMYTPHGHNGMNFTTIDRDYDRNEYGNCARYYDGGWWYNKVCFSALPTGKYSNARGGRIKESWYSGKKYRHVKHVDMRIR